MPVITRYVSKRYGVDWTRYELIHWHDDELLRFMCQENISYINCVWFREVTKENPVYLSYSKDKPENYTMHVVI